MNVNLKEEQKIKILNSDDLYKIMQDILLRENKIDRDKEHFWVVGLLCNNRIAFIELISLGTKKNIIVEPMEVFSVAIQKRAVKIIIVHNHPSAELQPTSEDKEVTDRLIQVGLIVDVPVVNHLIISERSYISFLDIGLMEKLYKSEKYVPLYKIEKRIRKEVTK